MKGCRYVLHDSSRLFCPIELQGDLGGRHGVDRTPENEMLRSLTFILGAGYGSDVSAEAPMSLAFVSD